MIQALRLKIEGIDVSNDFFDSFYSKEEQISRVIAFITMEEIEEGIRIISECVDELKIR